MLVRAIPVPKFPTRSREELESHVGRTEERSDTVRLRLKEALAATLDCANPVGDELPALWHWALFQHWAPGGTLGPDGHAPRGAFLPEELTYPRRMWAGGQINFKRKVRVEQLLTRRSRLVRVAEKQGTTGPSLWVSVEHELLDDCGSLLSERQDLVYRTADSPSPLAPVSPPIVAGAVTERVPVDAVLLFRYSAVTGNSHRIHYDQQYARSHEGYESLVVQGALQATLLAAFAQRQEPGNDLRQFAFRARWPALLHRCPLMLEAWRVNELWQLCTRDSEGSVCMTAEASFGN